MLVKTFSDIERPSVIKDKGHTVSSHLFKGLHQWTLRKGAGTPHGKNNLAQFQYLWIAIDWWGII